MKDAAQRFQGIRWPLYWMLTAIGAVYVAASVLGFTGVGGCDGPIVACDAAAYYYVDQTPYDWDEDSAGVPPYRYSPAFLALVAPFRLLGFDAFVWLWAALHVAVLLWLRAGWMLAVPGLNEDVIRGNVNVFVAALIVLAIRYPVAWAPVLLTKVTPVVGLVWHGVRGEWSELAVAYVVTAAITAVGIMLDPQLWADWLSSVFSAQENYAGIDNILPLSLRILVGAGIVAAAARSARAWLVPIGVLVAWPGILPPAFMLLAAVPRLWKQETR